MREIQVGGPRARRHGVALVDDDDYALVDQFRWNLSTSPNSAVVYAIRTLYRGDLKTTQRMHRLITGSISVDHIDMDGLNNQRSNLRVATRSQNGGNRRSVAGTSSRLKGVFWYRRDSKWRAAIGSGGRGSSPRHLGYFVSEETAARAYDAAARLQFGEFARLNFPEGN